MTALAVRRADPDLFDRLLAGLGLLVALIGLMWPIGQGFNGDAAIHRLAQVLMVVPLALVFAILAARPRAYVHQLNYVLLVVVHGVALTLAVSLHGRAGPGFWALLVAVWLGAWLSISRLAKVKPMNWLCALVLPPAIPILFGVWVLFLWEAITRGAGVPTVLLPPPSMIGQRILEAWPLLLADFQQTFLKAVLAGFVLGNAAGFLTAIAVDRSPFLQRGLLPLGNFVSALPIIGIAPIMVMWFGFDWPSKAAVVVVMTFFPMLVNAVAGLSASGRMERDLMRTYAASYSQTLFKLRLPAAAPFIFNALKINSTLALIGAIVAEFFGTPIVGMGFRISTEVGRMNVDMVWAEIAVAALAGSVFYAVVALVERWATFWHPSIRRGGRH